MKASATCPRLWRGRSRSGSAGKDRSRSPSSCANASIILNSATTAATRRRRFADFYTSVDVHPIFGRLLARQLAEMWEVLGRPAEFWAVEAAAGTGRLAAQVLDFAASELGSFYEALRYVAVEQSAARRGEHGKMLAAHLSRGRASLGRGASAGDSRRVHLLERTARRFAGPPRCRPARQRCGKCTWLLHGEELVEQLGPLSTRELESYFREQGITLREGQQAEAGLEACRWIAEAGKRLGRGFVLTVDYGREAAELYDERHMRGTLLAYSRHRATRGFLARAR